MENKKEIILNEVSLFNKRFKDIALLMKKWLLEENLLENFNDLNISNTEEFSGLYDTFLFTFKLKNSFEFELKPYGIWIVGAACRIDIKGRSGKEILVYVYEGGPATTVKISTGNNLIEENTSAVYGYLKEGWYWYMENPSKKPEILTKELFFSILERIN